MCHASCISYKPRGRRNNYKTTVQHRSNTLGSAWKPLPSRFAIHPRFKPTPFFRSLSSFLSNDQVKVDQRKVSILTNFIRNIPLHIFLPRISFRLNVLSARVARYYESVYPPIRQTNQIHHDTRACPFDNVTMENAIFPPPP